MGIKLNGWQRLWVVVSVPFYAMAVIGPVTQLFEERGEYYNPAEIAFYYFINGVGWPLFFYAVGWSIAWIRRGFKEH